MILRKPYAFIIKHFRLLHLIILGCLFFILYNFNGMSNLVNTLLKSNIYTYAGADLYINNQLYYFIFGALAVSGVLFWLLNQKHKPTRLYLGLIIYLVALTLVIFYVYRIFYNLTQGEVPIDSLALVRDLLVIIRIPTYIFIGMTFLRGIGFNIKQFNFSKDIAELKLVEEDSAEFELMIGQNNYKYLRFIRRTIREIKYYILENLVAITTFFIVVTIILLFLLYRYYSQYIKRLKESEITTVNGITYVVNSAYITGEDHTGKWIKDKSKFVVVNMSFNNTTSQEKTLDYTKISLRNKELAYYPTLSYNSKFFDLGVPYQEDTIIPQTTMLERYIVFEIPDTSNVTDYTLRVEYGIEEKRNKVLSQYRKFQIKAVNIDEEDRVINANLNEEFTTNVINKNRMQLTIKKYNIQENYNNRYVLCDINLNCKKLTNLITANRYDRKTMLVIDYEGIIDEDAEFLKNLNTYRKIFDAFTYIRYTHNNILYLEKIDMVPTGEVDDKVFALVDRRIITATNIEIIFYFRNNTYVIKLK